MIWKQCVLENRLTQEEAQKRAEYLAGILAILKTERMSSEDDFRDVMKLATGLNLTFYDASYLYIAKSKGLTLVTEDHQLRTKATQADIQALGVSELTREE